jgi:hypothetical protein
MVLATSMLVAAALGATPTPGRDAATTSMRAIAVDGYRIEDAEYWPFEGDTPFQYPADVVTGFYPPGTPRTTTGCAERAYAQAQRFFAAGHGDVRLTLGLGGTPRIVIQVNDYVAAADGRYERPAKLRHWDWGAHDYRSGEWVWEATAGSGCTCLLPDEDAALATFADAASELREPDPLTAP